MCVCVLSSTLQGSSVRSSRKLGYVSPAPQAAPKDLFIIHPGGRCVVGDAPVETRSLAHPFVGQINMGGVAKGGPQSIHYFAWC